MGLSGACNKVVNKTLVCLELRLGGTKKMCCAPWSLTGQ